jgi:hypothetical protein
MSSTTEILITTLLTLPIDLIKIITFYEDGGERFQKVKLNALRTLRNRFLEGCSLGFYLKHWNELYEQALTDHNWEIAKKALQQGAFTLDVSEKFLKLLQEKNLSAAKYLLTQEISSQADTYQKRLIPHLIQNLYFIPL